MLLSRISKAVFSSKYSLAGVHKFGLALVYRTFGTQVGSSPLSTGGDSIPSTSNVLSSVRNLNVNENLLLLLHMPKSDWEINKVSSFKWRSNELFFRVVINVSTAESFSFHNHSWM